MAFFWQSEVNVKQPHTCRLTRILALGVIAILLCALNSKPANSSAKSQLALPDCVNPDAHLELSIEPSIALPGTLVTLNITYHQIGLPYTYLSIDRPFLVVYEPPISNPCPYCSSVTLRTQAPGVVQFHAGATGELWGEDCHCWCWGSAQDNGPATLIIAESISKLFLPSVYR